MIYDHRTYTCRPGTVPLQLALYEAHGWPVQTKHIGLPVLYGTTEIGNVNAFVHVWRYESLAERTAKRAAMFADPDWAVYLKASNEAGYIVAQENKILVGAPFWEAARG